MKQAKTPGTKAQPIKAMVMVVPFKGKKKMMTEKEYNNGSKEG